MKKNTKVLLGFVIGIIILLVIIFKFVGVSAGPGKYDDFAKCLSASDAKMYGAYWCPHCQDQKKEFGSSWQYVSYIECDARGDNGNPALCQSQGIEGYPTWIFADGTKSPGIQSFAVLSQKTNCALPTE